MAIASLHGLGSEHDCAWFPRKRWGVVGHCPDHGPLGPDVTDWQRDLRQVGRDLVVDGWFGPQTEERTLDIQRFFDLPLTDEADKPTRDVVDYLMIVQE